MQDIGLMEVFGWRPVDFEWITPRFRAECILYLSARAQYARDRRRDLEAKAQSQGRVPRR